MATIPQRPMPLAPSGDRADGGSDAPVLGHYRKLDIDSVLAALKQDGMIGDADLAKARADARSANAKVELHPLALIANQKAVNPRDGKPLSLEVLTQWLADKAKLPYLKIDPMKIDVAAVTKVISSAYAQRYRILPVAVTPLQVVFATCEPFDTRWIADLGHILRRDLQRVVCNPVDLNRYLVEFYGVQRSIQRAKDAKGDLNDGRAILNFEQLLELGKSGDVGADDRHVVHIVDWLLQYAFEQRASDIHLEPRRDTSPIRFRIDGVMHKVFELPTPVMVAVTARVKILGRMDLAEKRRPQDGRIKTRSGEGREVELRLSTMPTAFGEKVVMRIFDPDIVVKEFRQLGFSPDEETLWRSLVERPHGIVLVTGPTGSGKTTTLYSTLKHLATPDINVCTVEDPIEMVSPDLNQMQVQPAIDLDFATGVRTLLRQDPDIIMVGEIRDLETAQMAIQASLTGHLVLSTLHTNDAPSALPRLLDLGAPHYLIQSTLTGVVAQRLVRTLCPHCKVPADPLDPDMWRMLTMPFRSDGEQHVHAPVGCLECRMTGYLGRIGLYEIMTLSPIIRRLIHADADDSKIREQAYKENMKPLRVSGAAKIAAGLSTAEEVIKVVPLG
jgi:general secretion pathway protein E